MTFLENILSKAKDVAGVAGKKTGEIVEISKQKYNAANIGSEIKIEFEKLGKSVYSMIKADKEDPDYVLAKVSKIDALYANLNEVNDRIMELMKKKKCESCGEKNEQNAVYCSKCGAKLPESQEDIEDETFL